MIVWLVRATFGLVLLGAAGYVIVAVPVGRRTLFEHGLQIVRTQPAQELAEDLRHTASEAVSKARASLDAVPDDVQPPVGEPSSQRPAKRAH